MLMEIISTKNAPAPQGPYSQAVSVGGRIFTSGQMPIVPETGELIDENIEKQTTQVLDNLKAVLQASGSDLCYVAKITLYVKDLNYLDAINKIYCKYFIDQYPARSCIEVARLPKDAGIEIEATAFVP